MWATLSAFGANPKRLGGQVGATLILHTWGQTLTRHVHLHALIPGGALSASGHWRSAKGNHLFPVRALSRHVRGHFVSGLRRRAGKQALAVDSGPALDALLTKLMQRDWVVYARPCLGRTETVVAYLSRYSHRTALTDRRLWPARRSGGPSLSRLP